MYTCLLCALLLIGCSEEAKTDISNATATPSAVSVSQNNEQDLIGIDADENLSLSEKDASKEINTNLVDVRKQKYKHAKELIGKRKYKEAYDILVSLNAHRAEFPKLLTLIKKVKILELGRIKKWKENNSKNQIIVMGRKVKVRIRYTSKDWKDKVANYTGEINYKQSTAYKIAIVHGDKLDYIRVDDSLHNIFDGCIEYEVCNARSHDYIQLYSQEGEVKRKESEKEYQKYLEKNRANDNKQEENVENDNEQEKIAEHNEVLPDPSIGMTASEVESSSWGKPEKKNITEYAWGTEEQWVYSNYRYVYLKNGIVTSIQRSE